MADVVIVTVNYRLGALGFLSLKDETLNVPGNAGLKDQRMALKFVKNNIQNFGGDPENICLMGHSTGGSSVSWHCVSEGSKGLFNRAIIMSGCVLNDWSLTPHRDWANRLAKKLGYEGSNEEKEILTFLRGADPVKIVEHQSDLIHIEEKHIWYTFTPSVEHYWNDDAFILKEPIDAMRTAWSSEIDVMIGGTSDEGLLALADIRNNPEILANFKQNSMVPHEVTESSSDIKPKIVEFTESLRKMSFPPLSGMTTDELAYCKVVETLFIIDIFSSFLEIV